MEHTINISEDRTASIDVTIPYEDLKDKYEQSLRELRQKVVIPGFRRGMAPAGMIRQRYGKSAYADIVEEATRDSLKQLFDQYEAEIAGEAEIEEIAAKQGEPVKFTVSLPFRSEPKLIKHKGLKVTVNKAPVTDADIDHYVEEYRRGKMAMQSVDDPATFDAKLTVNVQEVDPSGLTLVGKPVEQMEISFGEDELGIGTDEQLLGIRTGEKRVVQARVVEPEKGTLIVSPDQARRTNAPQIISYSVEAVRVELPVLPELNEGFFKSIDESLVTLDDFRGWIRSKLQDAAERIRRRELGTAIIKKLIAENPFPLSKLFIRQAAARVVSEQKLTPDQRKKLIENNLDRVEEEMRYLFLRDLIIAEEKIAVSDEELDAEILRVTESFGDESGFIRQYYSEPAQAAELKDRMTGERVMDLLAAEADVDNREITLEEMLEEDHRQHHHHHHHHEGEEHHHHDDDDDEEVEG